MGSDLKITILVTTAKTLPNKVPFTFQEMCLFWGGWGHQSTHNILGESLFLSEPYRGFYLYNGGYH